MYLFTCFKKSASSVIKIALASSSCSACEIKSIATHLGLQYLSAIIKTSEGPAIESMPTYPKTCLLASATKALPGPTILSTFGTTLVPKANAAMACAPPSLKIFFTPHFFAAYNTPGFQEIYDNLEKSHRPSVAFFVLVVYDSEQEASNIRILNVDLDKKS